ncbi:MAG: sulfotransferase family protein [Acidimicrobiia bacterium]
MPRPLIADLAAGLTGENPSPPFFILGAARSGTTLLRVLLDSHPHLSVGPETNVLHHWFDAVENAQTLRFYPYPPDDLLRYPAAAFELMHIRYMRDRGKRRWGDKTPNYVTVLDDILKCWPEAQVIHCIRDGRDVVCSMRERWGWSVRAGSRRWRDRVEKVLTQAANLSARQYLEVRYEQLVSEPRYELSRILRFLEEPWDESVLDHSQSAHNGVEDDVAEAGGDITTESVGRWRQQMSPLDRYVFGRQAASLLRRLGYR